MRLIDGLAAYDVFCHGFHLLVPIVARMGASASVGWTALAVLTLFIQRWFFEQCRLSIEPELAVIPTEIECLTAMGGGQPGLRRQVLIYQSPADNVRFHLTPPYCPIKKS